jgi:large subunit ribosomal protein L7/L12
MDARLILIAAAVGVACFVLGLLVGGRRRDGSMIVQRSPLAPAAQQQGVGVSLGGTAFIDLQLAKDVEQLLSAGKKIEAIRIVRERTGLGLKESKETVERLEGLMKKLQS